MQYTSYNNFDLDPCCEILNISEKIVVGNNSFLEELKAVIEKGNRLIAFDLYPTTDKASLISLLKTLNPEMIFDTDSCKLSEDQLFEKFGANITDDRVFGTMTLSKLDACFDSEKVKAMQDEIKNNSEKLVFVVGVGTNLFCTPQVHYYFDITRWEIQLRFRKQATNWLFNNPDAPILTKYKIGFFLEWRLADEYKRTNIKNIDFMVDANNPQCLRMISKDVFMTGLKQISEKPFRMQPYYDESVWGGQWMKNKFGLDKSAKNYGWSFDGVPEENSIKMKIGSETIEFPTMNLVKLYPENLLGKRVYGRFGAEFPIRFDYLDTFEGGNLSLQVHPLTEYIQKTFGMHYTQDESYYILDTTENGYVYLGVKENVDPDEMKAALERANRGEELFDAEKFVNKVPVKKHDHVLIPAGTVHCSGKDTNVLEISATPYIFTFKLWDWGRLGLDGLPRPVHIEHGMKNIQFNRDTKWITENLIHQDKIIEQSDDVKIQLTGLHEYEFISTKRYTLSKAVVCNSKDSVTVLTLVDGKEGYIKSPDNNFAPQIIHYGETFIVPAYVGDFILSPADDNKEVMFITASVRGSEA